MRKILCFILFISSFVYAFDAKQADELGMIALKEEVLTAKKEPLIPFKPSEQQVFGAWYLYHFDEDEFFSYTPKGESIPELNLLLKDEDFAMSVEKAYLDFNTTMSKLDSNLTGKIFEINIDSELLSYDFEKEYFPFNIITPRGSDMPFGKKSEPSHSKLSKMNFYGEGLPVCKLSTITKMPSTLKLKNISLDKNIIPMPKDEAKAFLASRNQDRNIIISVFVEILDIKSSVGLLSYKSCLPIEVSANIKSIKITDPYTKKVIYQIDEY